MHHLLAFAELLDEFLHAVLVEVMLCFRGRLGALVA